MKGLERILARYHAEPVKKIKPSSAKARRRWQDEPGAIRVGDRWLIPQQCRKCGIAFYTRADKMSQGRGKYCGRGCMAADRTGRPGLAGAANPNWKGGVSSNNMRYRYRYRALHPEKVLAHKAVQQAVQEGRLVRPETCERCGKPGRIEAHHHNYSRRLDVTWLCRTCHVHHHQAATPRRPRRWKYPNGGPL